MRIADKTIEVPQRFLFDAENICLDTIRLRVPTPKTQPEFTDRKGEKLWKEAEEVNFFILFEFGPSYDHGTEKDPVEVFKGLMIIFEEGKLKGSELAVPSGDFSNKWRFKTRYLRAFEGEEESVGEYGPEEKVKLPWSRSDGQ